MRPFLERETPVNDEDLSKFASALIAIAILAAPPAQTDWIRTGTGLA